jgi:hypothetical protein
MAYPITLRFDEYSNFTSVLQETSNNHILQLCLHPSTWNGNVTVKIDGRIVLPLDVLVRYTKLEGGSKFLNDTALVFMVSDIRDLGAQAGRDFPLGLY